MKKVEIPFPMARTPDQNQVLNAGVATTTIRMSIYILN
jgi:hypothetical protein